MAPTQPSPESSTREQMIVEAWAQGLNVGAVMILILLVLCNYRHKALLHKLILSEVGVWRITLQPLCLANC